MSRARATVEPPPRLLTCSGCPETWTAAGAAHCGAPGCHRTFAGATLFDRHRHARGEHGGCLAPAAICAPNGERIMFFRDGMWRGPEAGEDLKARWRELKTRTGQEKGIGDG